MRKIEQNMIEAIKAGRDYREGNTEVIFSDSQTLGIGRVNLHGNNVAIIFSDDVGDTSDSIVGCYRVRPNPKTFVQYPTCTTCSRLKALGIDARVRNHQPVLEGVTI